MGLVRAQNGNPQIYKEQKKLKSEKPPLQSGVVCTQQANIDLYKHIKWGPFDLSRTRLRLLLAIMAEGHLSSGWMSHP